MYFIRFHRPALALVVIFGLTLALVPGAYAKGLKGTPRVMPLSEAKPVCTYPSGMSPQLRSADTCHTYAGGDIAYYIYPWVVGDELYKAYQDPSLTCENPYPYTIQDIQFVLFFVDAATVYISVDVEDADRSDPDCPVPDTVMTISPLYEIAVTEADLYLITFTLDTPVVVNAPFFVGAYFADAGTPSNSAVITDSIPAGCVSYNDWGEGYVDLDTVYNYTDPDNPFKIFPGRVVLFASGTLGGQSGDEPVPAARWIHPVHGQLVGGSVELWADDGAGSEIIKQALFQYYSGSQWISIGTDSDDSSPLRNGVSASGSGEGLTVSWNTASLAEGDYQLRVIVSDTLGRADTADIEVTVDPSPPFPTLSVPTFGQNVCTGLSAQVLCSDEDISYMTFDIKKANLDFELPLTAINQNLGGDTDDDPDDGNPATGGEYGDYCSGPAAAATAIHYWYDRGYTYLLTEGTTILTDAQLMDRLYTAMQIQDNLGAYDGALVSGLRDYILAHGSQLDVKIDRQPTLNRLWGWMGNYEYIAMLGISGSPGLWMTVAGNQGFADEDGICIFRLADPVDGAVELFEIKEESNQLWILYEGDWAEIDLLVATVPYNWKVTRTAVGVDATSGDGWGFYWNTSGLSEDSLYFLYTTVVDQDAHKGNTSVLTRIDCQIEYVSGDVDNDGSVTAADLVYLTDFLYGDGPAPILGNIVADVNCDGSVTISDVIYLHKYLFLSGPTPCP